MVEFHKGQQVIHCRDGLAVIVDEILMSDKTYFIVKTVRGDGENIYVPIERAEVIIRPLLSEKEASDLLEKAKGIEVEYNPNTKQRRDSLKRRLGSGDVNDSIHLLKQLYFYKTLKDGSVKYGPVDLDMIQYASNNLLDELAIVFDVDRNSIEEFVFKRIV